MQQQPIYFTLFLIVSVSASCLAWGWRRKYVSTVFREALETVKCMRDRRAVQVYLVVLIQVSAPLPVCICSS
ncbi:hypothetical protein HBI56_058510 [Parastagonospora nodorum]|uniref:Uncharacterized protein n=1 Tax=Phaeosphaeria nodorum (strain SN15 / ATCC MYA-4574 / FGSC 10173) TaxID=321614 RepID=A0A7U2I0A6_PHANO|nr:hypothetical protein HBH56_160130 [Parastagonospora nodorum]QRC97243.1 hypothetical protein JI435_410320 [Parastagonospora nodorum SN15]KAH3922415.1 hypothetical protein HBH54_224560 [Parastagonospora nodorum]KAH3946883.1 hypothetical protein HBH53_121780 [Parastagonospora nodorum]KAH3969638.1 hypothetical protein HBH52_169790 [Parastagonospora nodorum]